MKHSKLIVFLGLFIWGCSHTQTKSEFENGELEKIPETCRPNTEVGTIAGHGKADYHPLMQAVFDEDVSKVKELIRAGHNIHAKDALGLSYLHLAAAVGHPDVIDVLVDAGLPVNAKLGKKKSTPAHSAARWGKLKSIQVLKQRGADFSLTDADGKTPSEIAAAAGHEDVVRYLNSI